MCMHLYMCIYTHTHTYIYREAEVVPSAYLRLLILPAILIPACGSSSPAFRMMYSANMSGWMNYKLESR